MHITQSPRPAGGRWERRRANCPHTGRSSPYSVRRSPFSNLTPRSPPSSSEDHLVRVMKFPCVYAAAANLFRDCLPRRQPSCD
ncbi:hypothetical protein BaRGS_00033659 [Batillaria attramentaria]|uniref:Uncharacterized protein n=1 Tax=Batillaria attramentaria TaxID=370345 RepID=A0ABD0JJI9_9CAEN